MTRPTFAKSVGVAFVLAALGTIVIPTLGTLVGLSGAGRFSIALLSGLYLAWLLPASSTVAGKPTAVTVWLVLAALIEFCVADFFHYMVCHSALIWLTRLAFFFRSPIVAVADLALNSVAIAAAVAAFLRTGSVFLALWSYFLLQATSSMPVSLAASRNAAVARDPAAAFTRAQQQAEAALESLIHR